MRCKSCDRLLEVEIDNTSLCGACLTVSMDTSLTTNLEEQEETLNEQLEFITDITEEDYILLE